jgi:hypothetical protein
MAAARSIFAAQQRAFFLLHGNKATNDGLVGTATWGHSSVCAPDALRFGFS